MLKIAQIFVESRDLERFGEAKRESYRVLAEYESYIIAEADDSQINSLKTKDFVIRERPEFHKIKVGDVEFESHENRETLGLSSFGYEDEFYVLQFVGPPKDYWLETFEKLGVKFLGNLSYNAYVVNISFNSIHQVTSLRNSDFLRFITPFIPDFKISSRLKGRKGILSLAEFKTLPILPECAPYDKMGNLVVILHDDAYLTKVTMVVEGLKGEIVKKLEDSMRIAIEPSLIVKLSEAKGVKWMEHYALPELSLKEAVQITNAQEIWGAHNLTGEGQIVCVADTGIDKGVNDNTMHPDFIGRIERIHPWGRPNHAHDDRDGHGTHVAGIVVGNGKKSHGDIKGIAYGAKLIFQSIMDTSGHLGGIPDPLGGLFSEAYNEDARIHNNSWGTKTNGQYTKTSGDVDKFVWEHRHMVIVFAAGNEGTDANPSNGVVDLDSLMSPGTAKNCITVGGCENNRPGINLLWGAFHNPPPNPTPPSNRVMNDDRVANNPEGMMAISSRGPTDDKRTKPDLVAPGSSILSTKSRLAAYSTGWGTSPDSTYYMFMGGTSMAAPIVSGLAALIRQNLMSIIENGDEKRKRLRKKVKEETPPNKLSPTAALIKAILIHGARKIKGHLYDAAHNDAEDHSTDPSDQGRIPNHCQGYGRVDLQESLFPRDPTIIEMFDGHRVAKEETREYQFLAEDRTVPLKATLVWTDVADFPNKKELVNNLDLVVHTPDKKEYHGNFIEPQAPGNNLDSANNVEKIIINTPESGIFRVDILANSDKIVDAPGGKGQDFALVVSGDLKNTLKARVRRFKDSGTLDPIRLCNKYNPNPCLPKDLLGDGPLIKDDDRQADVEILQKMLIALGQIDKAGEKQDDTFIFGPTTQREVKNFQTKNKKWDNTTLLVDGKVGPETSDALNRAMVGKWYSVYITPKRLTGDWLLVTATKKEFEKGISILTEVGVKETRIVVKENEPSLITLWNPSGKRFSFDDEGDYDVVDGEEKSLQRGKIKKEDDIKLVKEVAIPFTVELQVKKTLYTFYGEEEIT
jgi:serine protease AprX